MTDSTNEAVKTERGCEGCPINIPEMDKVVCSVTCDAIVPNIQKDILKTRRQYFIDKVKKPFLDTLIMLANLYPIPTRDNLNDPFARVWIDIFEKFFEMEDNSSREGLFRAIERIMICEPGHDPYYRDRILVIAELFLEAVMAGKVKPRSLDHPQDCWKVDPNKRGRGYEFMKACYFYQNDKEKIKEVI